MLPPNSAVVAALLAATTQVQSLQWLPGFHAPGMDAPVSVLAAFPGRSGPELVAGGQFSRAGAESALGIARWNGSSWSTLGRGVTGSVTSLAVFDAGQGPVLYVHGPFDHAGLWNAPGFARWDGTQWSLVPGASLALSNALAGFATFDLGTGQALYAWGEFPPVAGLSGAKVARFDGTSWQGLGQGPIGTPTCAVVHDDGSGPALVVATRPTTGTIGDLVVQRWNGTSWVALGSISSSSAERIATLDDGAGPTLLLQGILRDPLTLLGNSLARFFGPTWTSFPLAPGVVVRSMQVLDTPLGPRLFVGAQDLLDSTGRVDRWDNGAWTTLGQLGDAYPTAQSFATANLGAGRRLFVGGSFSLAGDAQAANVAEFDGTAWHPLGGGNGVDRPIECLRVYDDGSGPALYAGGSFRAAGTSVAPRVARWNGTSWTPVGAWSGPAVHALAAFDDGTGTALFAGHDEGVSKWDGTNWSPVASSPSARVNALAVFDSGQGTELVAAGTFSQLGAVFLRNVAAWNGTSWRQLGTGLDGAAWALQVLDDGAGPQLYAGGDDALVGATPTIFGLARWDGHGWNAVPGCPVKRVRALALHPDGPGLALAVGGFTRDLLAGNFGRVGLFRNGVWTVLGGDFEGLTREVYALASIRLASGRTLFAGGNFALADGASANGLARWSGGRWNPVDGGVLPLELGRDGVTAIAGFDDGSGTKIHVGGHFTSAGGIPAKNFGVIADRTPPGSRPPTVPSIVAVPVGETYCAGDGSASPCPCLNHGAPAHGCRSAAFASGARLDADGVSALSSDSLVLRTTATPSGQFAVFLQGDRRANGGLGLASFDGLACLDGSLVRLGTKFSAGASAVFPQATDRPISIVGGVPVAGAVRHYQVQYRETNALYCSPEPVNWTNALTVVWRP